MAVTSKQTVFLSGKLSWFKALGDPVPNYNKDGNEWSFNFSPDEAGVAKIKALKLGDRLKNKDNEQGDFLVLKRSQYRVDGSPNDHIRVLDKDQNPWDHALLLGNGTEADVKLDIRDYGPGKKAGIYPVAVRITDRVPYEAQSDFGALDEERGVVSKPKDTVKDDFLDDDVPF